MGTHHLFLAAARILGLLTPPGLSEVVMKQRNYGNSGTETAAANVAEALKKILEGSERRRLLGAAFRLCRNVGQAEELVQEACYHALTHARRYDSTRPLMPWLMGLLWNIFLDSRKRERAVSIERHLGRPESRGGLVQMLADGAEPALERTLRLEREAAIARQLGALKKIYREALVVRDVMGLSYAVGATRLKVPVGTLRSRLFRARAVLRRRLGRGV